MPVDVPALVAFNRGLISRKALARVDVDRVALSAEEQTNWMPRVLGSMSLRPGMKYLGATRSNSTAVFIPFVYAVDDTALIEVTSGALRIWDGATDTLVTRAEVTSTIANGSFASDLASWTDADESGAVSAWVTGGYMGLTGTGFNRAIRRQSVTTTSTSVEHAIRCVVTRGPITIKIGSSAGDDDYLAETVMRTGTHSLAFTPTASPYHVEFSASRQYQALLESCEIESDGTLSVPTPWNEAALSKIRHWQSRDVIFAACEGYRPIRIERYSPTSWSVVNYEPEDGPFRDENIGPTSIATSALNGDVTLTASKPFFKSTNVGGLIQLTSFGQSVEATFTGEDQFSDPIRVTGVGNQRTFSFTLSNLTGTSTTVTLQRSVNEVGAWVDITTYTTNGTRNYDDDLDNQIMYYRLGVSTGDYSSGTIGLSIEYSKTGTITGTARITAVASSTSASAIVLKAFGGTSGTTTWAEGEWSERRGWPTSVGFFEGRLWWFGGDRIWSTVSNTFDIFDPFTEGDSGPITRSIGDGPTEVINWMLPLQRMVFGAQGAAFSARSSSLDEPLTPSAFAIRRVSSQGSAALAAVAVDTNGYYVQRNGKRVYELVLPDGRFDYQDDDVTAIVPDVGQPAITRLAVQRQPDTRLHAVRSDGKVAVFIADRAENVRCWVLVEPAASGVVEDVVVLPGTTEDRVYYLVKRTVNEATVRYLERWATEDQILGADLTMLADSYVEYSGDATTTVSLPHLEGETVVVWADGDSVDDSNGDVRTFTVASGTITIPAPATKIVAGLAYEARFKSAKLAYAAPVGTSLTMRKRIPKMGLLLADTHHKGVQYGQSFDVMDDLPEVESGAVTADGTIWEDYDTDQFTFPGEWSTDTRLCLKAASPRPATVLAATFVIEGHRSF